MPTNSSTATLSLAGQLRSMGDLELATLLRERAVRETGIKDFFDLAETLLDRASIQHALGRLDRPTLTTLSVIAELSATSGPLTRADAAARLESIGAAAQLDDHVATALRLALLTTEPGSTVDRFTAYDTVIEQLRSWPARGLPGFDELISAPAPTALGPVNTVDSRFTDHVSAEHAFATTATIAELLVELQREPARELARGGIALPDGKRLAAAMNVELDEVAGLHAIAARAGLLALESGHWLPTPDSAHWILESSGERWSRLSAAWLARLPVDIRQLLAERSQTVWGQRLEEYVDWLFPAGGEWMRERLSIYTRDAEVLGITANQVPSTPGATLLAEGAQAAAAAIAHLFPPEVERVYLQHDLSVVSPGPLAPGIDARLRTMADVESRALATSYRISSTSVNRAMASGETAESLREFLSAISLTGIPQPLDYLIAETASRFGLLRVGALTGGGAQTGSVESGGRSYIRSQDDALLGTLLVDQSLLPLGLSRTDAHRVISRFDRDLVFWSLSEARYPVAAENENGEVIVLQRRSASRQRPATTRDPALALIERLRLGSSAREETSDQAWLTRQLETAIRNKLALTVTVTVPNGSTVDYQLEPASVAGGRLRARDHNSDIERTLPLSSITGISRAE